MAPEETRMTCWPRLRRRNKSATSVSSHVRLSRPVSRSTSSAEPTLTTMRRAFCRGEAATDDLAGIGKLYSSGNTLSTEIEAIFEGECGEQRLRAGTRAVVRESGRGRALPGSIHGRGFRARRDRVSGWGHRGNRPRNL